jgi:hypothetical protein
MNKQDAVKRIEAIEAEARALRAIIQAPDKPALPVRWRPERTDVYYQVAIKGDIAYYDERLPITDKEYEHGNCFQTRGHTEIASKAVSQTLKICAAAFAVDPDAGDFTSARRWSVVKQERIPTEYKWEVTSSEFVPRVPIFVHKFEQAKTMAAILNAEGV